MGRGGARLALALLGAVLVAGTLTGCERDRESWRIELVSANADGTDGGNPGSLPYATIHEPAFSPDGTKVVFTSPANNLGPRDTHSQQDFGDVYLRDLKAGRTTLISANLAGDDSGDGPSRYAMFADGGRKVVFQSYASDLVPTDSNGTWDIFVRDLATGTTRLVTANTTGTDSGDDYSSDFFTVSEDGRKVAFYSNASNLVPVDTNGSHDVFVHDLVAGTTTLASVNAEGTDSAPGGTLTAEISPDGTKVAFVSHTDQAISPIDTNGAGDIYVRDLVAGTTTLVSVNADGTNGGNGLAHQPQFSPDGRKLVFESWASDMGATDTNQDSDLYVRDLVAGTTRLVSVNASGTDSGTSVRWGTTSGGTVAFSPDSKSLVFGSSAPDLAPVDTNDAHDLFLYDVRTGRNRLLSTNAEGTDSANGGSSAGVFSPNGKEVAFSSSASNLGPPDNGTLSDVFVRDLRSGTTRLVTAGTTAADGLDSTLPRYSPDGRRIIFLSQADNLGPPDEGFDWDIYVATRRHAHSHG